MTIVKISLFKVHAERNVDVKGGQVNIKNNVSITNVEDLDFGVPGKNGLKFTFNFTCLYQPELGNIEVHGQVIFAGDEETIKATQDSWKADKKIPLPVMREVVNAALHKGNIQAIKVSEEVNLPSPLPLPKVNPEPATPEDAAPAAPANDAEPAQPPPKEE